MKFLAHFRWAFLCLTFALCSCVGGSNALPGSNVATGVGLVGTVAPAATDPLQLGPDPLTLTSDSPLDTITAQNDTPGDNYTPVADPTCQTADGGLYVAGDGQAQNDVAGAPLLFLVYAVGSPPASCTVTVTGSDGQVATIGVTYTVVTLQSVRRVASAPIVITPGAMPAAVTITKMNQLVQLAAGGFTGTTTATTGGCPTGPSAIQVRPKQFSGGAGTFVVVAVGQGSINKSCTVTITDSGGHTVSVPVNLAIGALVKFTVAPHRVQFGCAAGSLPIHCQTIHTVTFATAASNTIAVKTNPGLKDSCANVFDGPLKMVNSATLVESVPGPGATVAFDGLLPARPLGCGKLAFTDGGDPAQTVSLTVDPTLAAAPSSIMAATAPACTGPDPNVAVPNAPHGMYVWTSGHASAPFKTLLANTVIGHEPALCGASLVIYWSDVEPTKGTFTWGPVLDAAAPYTSAGLTVNLLFSDSTEGKTGNDVTAPWVIAPVAQGGDGAPTIQCDANSAIIPVYFNATYEADWEALIAAAVKEFSGTNSMISAQVGYMRFGIGGGAESIGPTGSQDGGACEKTWAAAGYSYAAWMGHVTRLIGVMGQQTTDKQLIASLAAASPKDDPDFANATAVQLAYAASNTTAAAAVMNHIGLSFESLGLAGVPAAGTEPAACNPQAANSSLHFCQAYTKYAGVVPLAAQSAGPGMATFDFANMLQYGLDNNIQIFELYPEQFFEADSPTWSGFDASGRAREKAAFKTTSLVVGAHPL